jgi:flagellar protein FlbD
MIKVTRLNGSELVINADLIEFVEAIPDTIVSLVTGKKIMIKESTDAVIHKVAEFKRLSSGSHLPKTVDQIQGADHAG